MKDKLEAIKVKIKELDLVITSAHAEVKPRIDHYNVRSTFDGEIISHLDTGVSEEELSDVQLLYDKVFNNWDILTVDIQYQNKINGDRWWGLDERGNWIMK